MAQAKLPGLLAASPASKPAEPDDFGDEMAEHPSKKAKKSDGSESTGASSSKGDDDDDDEDEKDTPLVFALLNANMKPVAFVTAKREFRANYKRALKETGYATKVPIGKADKQFEKCKDNEDIEQADYTAARDKVASLVDTMIATITSIKGWRQKTEVDRRRAEALQHYSDLQAAIIIFEEHVETIKAVMTGKKAELAASARGVRTVMEKFVSKFTKMEVPDKIGKMFASLLYQYTHGAAEPVPDPSKPVTC